MSPRQHKNCILGFLYIILVPIALVLINKLKWMRWWTQGSYGFGLQLVQNQVSLPCKMSKFLVISLGKLGSFTLISTELPFIFSARSGPFWQDAEALKNYSFRFQPSDLGQGHFSQVRTLFPEKIGENLFQ